MTSTAISPSPVSTNSLLWADNLHKRFILHAQGGICLPVLKGTSLKVKPGECVILQGPSGSGKSTFMRSLYANYRVDSGAIWVKHGENRIDLTQCQPHELMAIRQKTIGYVSQFLRVIPRVPALEVAAEPLMELGLEAAAARDNVRSLFRRLNLPERLWSLSPTTFSGGEKQRLNIARAFSVDFPILLLDEPTAALDAANREVVIELIEEKKARGCALIGIFHDEQVWQRVGNRVLTFGREDETALGESHE
ncbi:phosphonate C-P lyase system protein PhnL [Romeria aff. gracilis LEGE 07310]|uniref:Phosphonate C-P lyase system protein PhnL n=1 Tax=Vasconcelosia minhoensis LEGE 07310 TaxID=915328 RepID=A0A8J7AJR4_9CYAN|nr:phosphonate C-P lyase system protein PhnL [Romeria gracilis]MBE9075894.1 phosphonate C-P lyase system protein PhnL [Romeria aff. gracilis LEGE 07310]